MTNIEVATALANASDDEGTIQAHQMLGITDDPRLHCAIQAHVAARALGVFDEYVDIMGYDADDVASLT